MIYTQFLELNENGKLQAALGSDGVYILDGRNTIETMHKDAMKRFHKMKKFHKNYVGFKIQKSSRLDDDPEILGYFWDTERFSKNENE
jgi:hypothetical protein